MHLLHPFHRCAFVALSLISMCLFCPSIAEAADSHRADGGSRLLLQQQLQASSSLRAFICTSTNELLLQGRSSRQIRRSLASVDGSEEEGKDYLGDYSPSSNVDSGYVAPPPAVTIGNKRKLLQVYVPMVSTSPASSYRQQ